MSKINRSVLRVCWIYQAGKAICHRLQFRWTRGSLRPPGSDGLHRQCLAASLTHHLALPCQLFTSEYNGQVVIQHDITALPVQHQCRLTFMALILQSTILHPPCPTLSSIRTNSRRAIKLVIRAVTISSLSSSPHDFKNNSKMPT